MKTRYLAIFLAWFSLFLSILACGTTTTSDNVRIQDLPQFICATSIPQPTHTQAATQVQPAIIIPPSGYVTSTPYPGCIHNGTLCATHTPYPSGSYSTPAAYLPGATSTPRQTYTPFPSATPYILSGHFFDGADVYTGGFASAVNVRLSLTVGEIIPINETRQVVVLDVEIENRGEVVYSAIPGAQIFVAEVHDGATVHTGQWWASAEAAQAANITLQPEVLDVLEVQPRQSFTLTLTIFTPIGDPIRSGWVLDPLSGARDGDLIGGNVAYWSSDLDAACTTNPNNPGSIPTPAAIAPTPTPSRTPVYPPWCSWCGQ
ncbi:MAG: hypothetical protein RLP44_01610 [Aggregatilineales bacterium]